MTLLERANSTEVGYNYVSPYLGLRDICLSQDIDDVYYFAKSHNYLCVYKDYMALRKSKQDPVGVDSDTVWIKSVEGVKKVIPLNLRTIICVYDTHVEILDGLVCVEHVVNINMPIINAFPHACPKSVRLGVIYSNSKGLNSFTSVKLPYAPSREHVEVRSLISPYFFGHWTTAQVSKLLGYITEPIWSIEILQGYTQIITSRYVWLVGGPKVLAPYKQTCTEVSISCPKSSIVLYKSLDAWLDNEYSHKSLLDVAC